MLITPPADAENFEMTTDTNTATQAKTPRIIIAKNELLRVPLGDGSGAHEFKMPIVN